MMNSESEVILTTPVVLIVFNRPRHTREVFASIRAQRPSQLLIVADGPREDISEDQVRCQEVRDVISEIDWPCEVHRNYSDENMGCRRRVSSGLDWVFSIVDKAIILEDDCLPHADFFSFCNDMLERFKDDLRIFSVTGNNHQNGRRRGEASYYFSKYNHIWGWATWRRAWEKNSETLAFWPEWKNSVDWKKHTPDKLERKYWSDIFDRMYQNEIDTWDYIWTASVWFHKGLTVTPNVNLVTNIGFGPEGTHTVAEEDLEGAPSYPLGELIHEDRVVQSRSADRYVFDYFFGGIHQRLYTKAINLLKLAFNKLFR